ncbi:hypothetical protein Q9R46_14520 [Paenibacillus sp. RRE4]|uniref:hypothetical protein n=1 Tax=Paenibacillus sp. RRE4 TaxID=2962587 RepID=UPI002881C9E0|nr:hypothetical protein [Paenibacillus sp. RRE4]MDT0123872.1 hypothetical protein [Paenibacillus sp. RRE4]
MNINKRCRFSKIDLLNPGRRLQGQRGLVRMIVPESAYSKRNKKSVWLSLTDNGKKKRSGKRYCKKNNESDKPYLKLNSKLNGWGPQWTLSLKAGSVD